MKILNLRAGFILIVALVFMAIEPCVEAQTTKPPATPATPATTVTPARPALSAQQSAQLQAWEQADAAAQKAQIDQAGAARQLANQKYLSETKIDTSLPALGAHTGTSGTSTSGTGSSSTQPPSAADIGQQYIALVAKLAADKQAATQDGSGQASDIKSANLIQSYANNPVLEAYNIARNGSGQNADQLNASAQVLGKRAAADTARANKVQAALTALQAVAKQNNITLPTQSAADAATDEQVAFVQQQLVSLSRGIQKTVQAAASAGTPYTATQLLSADQTFRTAIRNANVPPAVTNDLIAQHLSDLDNTYNTTLAQLQAIPAAPGVTALEKREADDTQAQAVVAKEYSPADVQVWQTVGVSTGQLINTTATLVPVPQN